MHRKFLLIITVSVLANLQVCAQIKTITALDSMQHELEIATTDTSKILILEALVRNSFHLSNFDQSEKYLKQLEALIKKTNWPEGIVRFSFEKLRRKFSYEYQWDSALYYGRIGIAELDKDPEEFHPSWYNAYYAAMGLIAKNMEEFDTAFYYYDKSVNMYKEMDIYTALGLVISYRNIMNLHSRLGNDRMAREYMYKILEVANESGDEAMQLDAYSDLAENYYKERMYEKALEVADLLLKEYRKDSIAYIGKLNNMHRFMGACYLEMGEVGEAIKKVNIDYVYLTKAYGENHPKALPNLKYLGSAYLKRNMYDSAKYYLVKALDFPYDVNDKRRLSVLIELGQVEFERGNFDAALEYYSEAEKYSSKDPFRIRTIKTSLADVYLKLGEYDQALAQLDQSFPLKNDSLGITIDNLHKTIKSVYVLLKRAQILDEKSQGKYDLEISKEAVNNYLMADSLYNEMYSFYLTQEAEINISELLRDIYDGGLKVAYDLYISSGDKQHLERSFYFAERSKSNTLFKSQLAREHIRFGAIPDSLLEKEESLKSRVRYFNSRLTNRTILKKSKLEQLELGLFKAENALEELNFTLRKEYPNYFNLSNQDFLSFSQIQEQLSDRETVVEYALSPSLSLAFIITKKDIEVVELKLPLNFNEIVFQHKSELESPASDEQLQELSVELYALLIEPLKDLIQTVELIIVPDEALWYLNFDLLIRGGSSKSPNYLLYDYAISYANSLNFLYEAFERKSIPVEECLAFSFAREGEVKGSQIGFDAIRNSDEPLPGTAREIHQLANLLPGTYFYGSKANEKNFKSDVNGYSILHLALHGVVDGENPENSYLQFYQNKADTTEDDKLHAFELYDMELDADMAVLSACNTGNGLLRGGEGIISLGRAFQYAGVESLVISNWVLVDGVAPELVSKFYQNLKEGMTKSKALQQAKIAYLSNASESLSHPYYWGAFTIIGDKEPLFKKDNTLYYLVGGFILLIVLYIARKKPL